MSTDSIVKTPTSSLLDRFSHYYDKNKGLYFYYWKCYKNAFITTINDDGICVYVRWKYNNFGVTDKITWNIMPDKQLHFLFLFLFAKALYGNSGWYFLCCQFRHYNIFALTANNIHRLFQAARIYYNIKFHFSSHNFNAFTVAIEY